MHAQWRSPPRRSIDKNVACPSLSTSLCVFLVIRSVRDMYLYIYIFFSRRGRSYRSSYWELRVERSCVRRRGEGCCTVARINLRLLVKILALKFSLVCASRFSTRALRPGTRQGGMRRSAIYTPRTPVDFLPTFTPGRKFKFSKRFSKSFNPLACYGRRGYRCGYFLYLKLVSFVAGQLWYYNACDACDLYIYI